MNEPNLAEPYPASDQPPDTFWWRLVNLQPATWRGIVVAIFAFLAAVGIKVAPEIPDAAFLLVIALLPIAQGLWTKKAVTPNAKVAVYVPEPTRAPELVQPGEAVVPEYVRANVIEDAAKGDAL